MPETSRRDEKSPTSPATGSVPNVAIDWRRLHLWQIQPLRDALVFAAVIGIVYLGYHLSLVTIPILLAMLLAYLFEPLIKAMTRRDKVRRPFVAVCIIVLAAGLIAVPTIVGLTFGLIQGSRFVDSQLNAVQRLVKSLDQPENQALRDALPTQRWRGMRDWLVKQEARAKVDQAMHGAKRGAGLPDENEVDPKAAAPAAPQVPPSDAAPTPSDHDASAQSDAALAVETNRSQTAAPSPFSDEMESGIASLAARLVSVLRDNSAAIGKRAVQAGADAVQWGFRAAGTLFQVTFGAFLTGFFFYFFCTSWGRVLSFWESLIPDKKRGTVIDLVQKFDRVIAGFVRGRLIICLCQMVLFTLGYWFIGVPAPLIIGPIVGMLTLVPYLASLGVPLAMILLALEPQGAAGFRGEWWWIVFAPMGMQGVSQVMDDYILSPKIQGKNTDMSMPLILFASIAGGVLAGVYGLLLAIPVAACIKILLREVVWPRFRAWSEGKAADPLPIAGAVESGKKR